MRRRPDAVIGVGNSMRGDDGVGPETLARLASGPGAGDDTELLILDGEPARLLEAWRARSRVVVVDAVQRGDPPGTVHRLDADRDPLPGRSFAASSHSTGIADALELARILDVFPDELYVVGVEPADLTLGAGLSPPVVAAIPIVVAIVRDLLAGVRP